MGLLTGLFRLPFLPVQGVIRLGQLIEEQAEQELHDPASVRRQLEEAEQAQRAGEMSNEDVARAEAQAVGRLIQPAGTGAAQSRAHRDRS
jgi:Gas vesicle protein G